MYPDVHLCFIMSPGKILAVLELRLMTVALTVSFKLISFLSFIFAVLLECHRLNLICIAL